MRIVIFRVPSSLELNTNYKQKTIISLKELALHISRLTPSNQLNTQM